MNVAFVRGAFLNQFESQNYIFQDKSIRITAFSALRPIHTAVPFKRIGLPGLSDIGFPRFIANRTIGDTQNLYGLERYADRYDLFHTADPHYYYSYQLARLRASGRIGKLLMTVWETIPHNNETAWAKKKIKLYSMRYADAFLCHSVKSADCLKQEGIPDNRIYTVPLGVDLTRFVPFGKKQTTDCTVLFVGRLVPEKGVMTLLEAFRILKNKTAQLTIIGEGPLKVKINTFVKVHGLEHNITVKSASYDTIDSEYRHADIAVFPSVPTKTWEEQYGMVLVEAMASSLPVITYRTGAIPSIVGDAGVILPEGSAADLSAALSGLIANPALRFKLAANGRKRAETYYDARKTAAKIAQLYKSL